MEQALETIVKPLPEHLFVAARRQCRDALGEPWPAQGYHTPTTGSSSATTPPPPSSTPPTWRLRLHGAGRAHARACSTTSSCCAMPSRTIDAAIECAGNGRRLLRDRSSTTRRRARSGDWAAIGVARWRGVPLQRPAASRPGCAPDAVDVRAARARRAVRGVTGSVRRPLPVDKAMDDVLVAYEMNGEPLPPDHGFPVRLVVPGWVGIASIKWLGDIEVYDTAAFTPWNTVFYRTSTSPAGEERFRSSPGTPTLSAGEPARAARQIVVGARADRPGRGQLRRRAELARRPNTTARTWSAPGCRGTSGGRPSGRGAHVLMARATDETGRDAAAAPRRSTRSDITSTLSYDTPLRCPWIEKCHRSRRELRIR